MATRGRTVIIDGYIFAPPEIQLWKTHSFVHDGSDYITLPQEYCPGSTILHVDGLEWNPAWYEEVQDTEHRWKRIHLLYAIPVGANCWIRYYEMPTLAQP